MFFPRSSFSLPLSRAFFFPVLLVSLVPVSSLVSSSLVSLLTHSLSLFSLSLFSLSFRLHLVLPDAILFVVIPPFPADGDIQLANAAVAQSLLTLMKLSPRLPGADAERLLARERLRTLHERRAAAAQALESARLCRGSGGDR